MNVDARALRRTWFVRLALTNVQLTRQKKADRRCSLRSPRCAVFHSLRKREQRRRMIAEPIVNMFLEEVKNMRIHPSITITLVLVNNKARSAISVIISVHSKFLATSQVLCPLSPPPSLLFLTEVHSPFHVDSSSLITLDNCRLSLMQAREQE